MTAHNIPTTARAIIEFNQARGFCWATIDRPDKFTRVNHFGEDGHVRKDVARSYSHRVEYGRWRCSRAADAVALFANGFDRPLPHARRKVRRSGADWRSSSSENRCQHRGG